MIQSITQKVVTFAFLGLSCVSSYAGGDGGDPQFVLSQASQTSLRDESSKASTNGGRGGDGSDPRGGSKGGDGSDPRNR